MDASKLGSRGYYNAHAAQRSMDDAAAIAACPASVDADAFLAGWRSARQADEWERVRYAGPTAFVPLPGL